MCLVTMFTINGPMPRRKRQDNKYLCPSCGNKQTIVEVCHHIVIGAHDGTRSSQHTDMVMRLCAIPVQRLRQGPFFLHCMSCHAAYKISKAHLIHAIKMRASTPKDLWEPSTPSTPLAGFPLIAAGPPPRTLTSSTVRRASSGWAPQLAPVMEGPGKGGPGKDDSRHGKDVLVTAVIET